MIRIGICTTIEHIEKVKSLGYDYIELPLTAIMAQTQSDFALWRKRAQDSGLPVAALNCFAGAERRLIGEKRETSTLKTYIKAAADRAAAIGAKTVVLGSGAARKRDEEYPLRRAIADFSSVLYMINDVFAPYGITLVLEPLNHGETNLMHRVSEACYLASALSLPQVRVLGDTYHMHLEGEKLTALSEAGDLLQHVHVANPVGRVFPREGDGVDYIDLMRRLKLIGYDGGVSVEGNSKSFDSDAEAALLALRKAVKMA
ncbi:MAG: sugar phosphate isomerase/epimerase [Eubacteriales bacterium]|nr:sugar phosphate isomerase/epimerase [Eubacteriales bacterium]MDD3881183.1 sugar phosphate isomerase/epimerase [Eubacteriales bacterium]MDD4511565.1 sugar phosphate isomerase/epimerase [Eubacteriales bacterium]